MKRAITDQTCGERSRPRIRVPAEGRGADVLGALPRGPERLNGSTVAILTGGGDKPYALGLASALIDRGVRFDFIGSDEVDGPELHNTAQVTVLNLRGDQRPNAGIWEKTVRVLKYYGRLFRYTRTAKPRVFHILWNNKFALLDRTILMLYYRLLGKKIVFTAHNVNAGKRDGNDTIINRLTLKAQYRLADHIFVHTAKMKDELVRDFGENPDKVTVIPFGINSTVPNTALTPAEARERLGLATSDKVILFFGRITPYKGLEHLVSAFTTVARECASFRLIIAGRLERTSGYCRRVEEAIARSGVRSRIIQRIEFVPDEETEIYFKAADVLVLPYTHVFQSGVLFLGYNFGLPAIASDVGSLREEIVEGATGFVFKAADDDDLTRVIRLYFSSGSYTNPERRRETIRKLASDRYSWSKVGTIIAGVYSSLLNAAGR